MKRTLAELVLISSFIVFAGQVYAAPGQPTIVAPNNAETVNTTIAFVQWTGDSHTLYQVQVNTQNLPDTAVVYDSQQVTSTRFFAWSGTLSNTTTYYAFVRLGDGSGWGPWSTGRTFTVDTSYVPGGINYNLIKGNSYVNNSGPFLGLGFSYFRALQRCKIDRTRYQSDLAYMSSKGFNYQRALSMVSWTGVEIAPVAFGSVPAWSDYDQQFKDMIDIAYDSYGIKTEVTIFADAQNVMPSDSTRMAHLDRLLADLVGREHKVVLLEVGNELWQNGLPDANDVRAKGLYLANHTPIPVALSAPADGSDGGIVAYYGGSAADIATVHLSRDIGTVEGGWLPVRDSYRTGLSSIAPMSSNEPIGNGSSVASETDPIKLCMAGCFAWTANLPSYVFHCKAGIQGFSNCCPPSGTEFFFSATAGSDSYQNIFPLLPKDLAGWERNDGKVAASPFTHYSMGQANKWWMEVGGATNGCVRNIAAIKGNQFVTCAIGILSGGLELEARRPMNLLAYNPLTGAVAYNLTKTTGEHFTLAQGTGAYVIIGNFTTPAETPFSGTAVNIPGTLQAEDFDNGGEGVAYHDTDATNTGGQYRLGEGVDIETTTDTGGGFDVTGMATGEYLKYQMNVLSPGNYDISLRVASAGSGGTYHIEINNVDVTGSRNFSGTGGGQNWITTTVPTIALGVGVQTLKVVMESANWNLNYITLVWSSGAQPVTVTIQDTTPSGNSASVRDSYLRQIGDPTYTPGTSDTTNGGLVSGNGTRMYPDAGFPSGKAPRHNLIWFDLSGIPSGSTINSATYGFFLTSSSGPSITGYKLSRLNNGKDWIEGLGGGSAAANAGEPTWASRKHDHNPAWATAGAAGAADIDMGTTITWNKTAGVSETIALDVTAFVNGWVNGGVQNNGMLMWGGSGPGGSNVYFWLVTCEDTTTPALRPYLTINYTLPVCTTPTISTTSPACPNTDYLATITNPVSGGTYSWAISGGTFTGDVTTATGNPVTWSAASDGTVTITATQTGPLGGCTVSAISSTGPITINLVPLCSIDGPDPVCGGNHSYSGPASMDTYAWSVSGSGTINGAANGSSVSVDAGTSGSFTLYLTVTKNSCSSQCSKVVTLVCDRTITQWRSVRSHTSLGELPIVLNASASGNGTSGPAVETRNGGIQKIEVDFDGPVILANPAGVTVSGYTTVAGVMGGPTPYTPASVSMVDGDTLQILFNPGDLPDESCEIITIAAGTLAQNLVGDTDCNLRSLIGDAGGNGIVSLADMLLIKTKVSPPMDVTTGPQFDVNLSGTMTVADMLLTKGRVISPSKAALCP